MITYKGYKINMASPTGGDAGKGNNITSTIRVWEKGENIIKKHFRYGIYEPGSDQRALRKAKEYIDKIEQ